MAAHPKIIFDPLSTFITVDPIGDLHLIAKYGLHEITFRVSSKAMSLASAVWRTMLDPAGHFKESQPAHNKISIQDDDAEALLVLLLAAHLRFHEVPLRLWLEQLMNVCILCDKYDCIGLVKPWIEGWEDHCGRPELHGGHKKLPLLVAWSTGDEAKFEHVARDFVRTSDAGHAEANFLPPGYTGMLSLMHVVFDAGPD